MSLSNCHYIHTHTYTYIYIYTILLESHNRHAKVPPTNESYESHHHHMTVNIQTIQQTNQEIGFLWTETAAVVAVGHCLTESNRAKYS